MKPDGLFPLPVINGITLVYSFEWYHFTYVVLVVWIVFPFVGPALLSFHRRSNYSSPHLEFFFGGTGTGFFFVGLDGLQHTEAGGFDGFDGVFLDLDEFGVLVLEFFQRSVESLIGIRDLLLTVGDLSGDVIVAQGHDLFDGGFALGIAEIHVGRAADGFETLGEFPEAIDVASTAVVFQSRWVARFDGRVTLDAVSFAERFAISGTVNITNNNGCGIVEFFHQGVPSGLHTLTVSSPRGLELDKGGLAGSFGVPIITGKGGGSACADHSES